MPRVGFEPTISAGERPKTYALDRAATGTGLMWLIVTEYYTAIPIDSSVYLCWISGADIFLLNNYA